jgi:hypothetical protein
MEHNLEWLGLESNEELLLNEQHPKPCIADAGPSATQPFLSCYYPGNAGRCWEGRKRHRN